MRVRRTVLVLTAGALLVAPTAAAPAAQAGEQVVRPSRLAGRPVEATDEGAPTVLRVGDRVQRADADTDLLRYAIEKTDAASTLRVSVVGQATSADMLTGRLALELVGPDGRECDSALSLGNLRTPEILGAGVNAGPGLDCRGTAGTYTLVVEVDVGDTTPLGIRVSEEPAVDDVGFTSDLPSRVADTFVTGGATEVVGGTSYADAPEIGDGRWASRVAPGEVRLFRLPLDFGQSADVRVDFRPRGLGVEERRRTYVGLVLSDPMRSPLATGRGGESVETIDDPLTSAVPPISRARTITSGFGGVADWTMAGDHHVAVSMGDADPFDPASAVQSFTIHVAVGGSPADGPTYDGGRTWSVADGTSRAVPTRLPGPPWEVSGLVGSAAVPVAASGTGGVVTLLLLTGVLLLRRRRPWSRVARISADGRPRPRRG